MSRKQYLGRHFIPKILHSIEQTLNKYLLNKRKKKAKLEIKKKEFLYR